MTFHSDGTALRAAMPFRPQAAGAVLAAVAGCGLLAACSITEPQASFAPQTSGKEYFAESEYGVKASPRVSEARSRLPRGGGREQLGKPYKVKGKWYTPKEDPDYRNAGLASWYGDAFHGRLTANGEIYDMTHLTAAHPTMPLPSYARVTNTKNGNSVIVRVNDRGPFAHGRIIDLSRRAAELLDYTHNGIARVEVEYVGRAPLDGHDDEFLMASYRPGNRAPDPSDGLPTGVMIAMNGPTPTAPVLAAAFPTMPPSPALPAAAASAGIADPVLPELGPIAPERPGIGLASLELSPRLTSLAAFADARVSQAAGVLAIEAAVTDEAEIVASLRARYETPGAGEAERAGAYVAAGTFATHAEASRIAAVLAAAGKVSIEADGAYSVILASDGRLGTDGLLRAAWTAGVDDAILIRE